MMRFLSGIGYSGLVLERGRNVRHVADYPTATLEPWDLPRNDTLVPEEADEYKIYQRTGFILRESTKHWLIKDAEQPYIEKSGLTGSGDIILAEDQLLWRRQCLRWEQHEQYISRWIN